MVHEILNVDTLFDDAETAAVAADWAIDTLRLSQHTAWSVTIYDGTPADGGQRWDGELWVVAETEDAALNIVEQYVRAAVAGKPDYETRGATVIAWLADGDGLDVASRSIEIKRVINVDDDDIRDLLQEAEVYRDPETVLLCEAALEGDADARERVVEIIDEARQVAS